MQKWRVVLLGSLGICAILGVLIGIFLVNSGIGSNVISNLSIFDVFELICLVSVIICVIFDYLQISKDKKKFGQLKNNISNLNAGRTRFGVIAITCIVVFELIMFILESSFILLIMFLMAVGLAFLFLNHNIQKNGVNENGIFFWGVFFPWEKIKSYCAIEPHQINLVVIQKIGSNLTNKISLKITENEYEDVLKAFSERVVM